MSPDEVAPLIAFVTVVLGVASVLILRGPVGRALGRRLEGGAPPTEDVAGRLAMLEERLERLEGGGDRLTELEERLDFAERLLARPETHDTPV